MLFLVAVIGSVAWLLRSSYTELARQEKAVASNKSSITQSKGKDATTRPLATITGADATKSDLAYRMDQLRQAIGGNQETEVHLALERLAQFLVMHPESFSEALALFKADPALVSQIHLLSQLSVRFGWSGASQLLSTAALDLAEDSADATVRQLALVALGNFPRNNPEAVALVHLLSRMDDDMLVRHAAISTMAVWLSAEPGMHEQLSADLMDLARTASVREVRSYALQILIAHNPDLPVDVRTTIDQFLQGKPTVADRMMVALSAGTRSGDMRDFALGQMHQAFAEEKTVPNRRSILTEMVHLGNADAIKWLQQLPPANDYLLSLDVKDYLEILQSGVTDDAQIQQLKNQRDRQRGTIVAKQECND